MAPTPTGCGSPQTDFEGIPSPPKGLPAPGGLAGGRSRPLVGDSPSFKRRPTKIPTHSLLREGMARQVGTAQLGHVPTRKRLQFLVLAFVYSLSLSDD